MIVAVGTKGMLIKTAGVLLELDRRGVDYCFINLGQHGKRMLDLTELFGLKPFDVNLSRARDIGSIKGIMKWFVETLLQNKKVFKKDKMLVVQGDAPATLLAYSIAKTRRLKVAHIEAGFRSYNLLEPFPEEFIRMIVDKGSDILFAPSDKECLNLESERKSGKIFNTGFNTVLDAIRIALKNDPKIIIPTSEYVLVSIHRVENIYSHKRMKIILETLEDIDQRIIWPLHQPTKNRLVRYGLLPTINKIKLMSLQDYFSFIHLIKNATYIITDGGGPQEESYILGTPCLLMRRRTEHSEGLGKNVFLSRLNKKKIDFFVNHYEKFRTRGFLYPESPSRIIVDALEEEINHKLKAISDFPSKPQMLHL